MKRIHNKIAIFAAISLLFLFCSCNSAPSRVDYIVDTTPELFPDYTNTTFPSTIAPPNFCIELVGDEYYIAITGEDHVYFTYRGASAEVIIPPSKWRELCGDVGDGDFWIDISISNGGKWTQYAPIINSISTNKIDEYLAYRLLYPGYELWNEMGIYQRELSTYSEECVFSNDRVDKGCVNCHAFSNWSADTMMLHVRGKHGGTIIKQGDKTDLVQTNTTEFPNGAVYPSWHPQGRYIAFSSNEIRQYFHTSGIKPVEVSDSNSDLFIFDTNTNKQISSIDIAAKNKMETFPTWNNSGDVLYFCSADFKKDNKIEEVRYNLYSVSFDPETALLGDTVLVVDAQKLQKSISFPRVSPCGNYIMYTLSDYGNFSIWHPESDLYLLNLRDSTTRLMSEVNSSDVESYHCWSSSGDWFVFSSKRVDGLWAHPYIAAFDKDSGVASKPFALPQDDPKFYKEFMRTFNIPEFTTTKIDLNYKN